jgi:hypothetical protein
MSSPINADMTTFAQLLLNAGGTIRAQSPDAIETPGDRGAYVLFNPASGTILSRDQVAASLVTPEPDRRDYNALTIESFAQIVSHFAAKPVTLFVFIDSTGMRAVLNEDERHDRVTMPMYLLSSWNLLASMRDGGPMTQTQAIDLLRRRLDAVYEPANILATLGAIRFAQSEDAESTIQVGKASIGKRFKAELTGASALPETLTVTVPIWDNVTDGGVAIADDHTLGVQACAGASHAERRAKCLAEPRMRRWCRANRRLQIWSWSKKGGRGARKRWEVRVEDLTDAIRALPLDTDQNRV